MLHQAARPDLNMSKSQKESFQSESPTRGEVAKRKHLETLWISLVCHGLRSWRIFEFEGASS